MLKHAAWLLSLGLTYGVQAADKTEVLPLKELATFTDVLQKVKQLYVEPVSDKTLLNNAIQGMLVRLDPHSSFLEPEAARDFQEQIEGAFIGVGLELSVDKQGDIKVITPIEGGPAERAGIRSGDKLVRIDLKVLRGLSLKEIHDRLTGKSGSDIHVSVQRGNSNSLLEFKFKRERIEVKSLEARLLAPEIGYLKLRQFQKTSGQELIARLKVWQQEKPLQGLILDLRNNPGGLVSSAIEIADAFLESGLIVSTKGRASVANSSSRATSGDLLTGAPLVVLINGGSASASEIVAGALQDHQRALILGSRSFGKGSVQTLLPVQGNSALKLTTALYYTPSGRSIQAEGIVPDVEVASLKLNADAEDQLVRPKERDLPAAIHANKSKTQAEVSTSRLAYEDFQLFEAFNLVRAMRWGRK